VATVCITGSAGGIGAATRRLLEGRGDRVIGVDIDGAEVQADLSTPDGRAAMIAGVTEASGGSLDGVVAGAGVQGRTPSLELSINFFGALATLVGLRPLLAAAGRGSAVGIGSNSATTMAGVDEEAFELCLAGDEPAARARIDEVGGLAGYPTSKLALARWVRRAAPTPDWIGAGIRLNAIAPGPVATPMTSPIRDFVLTLGDVYPVPAQRIAEPEEIASVIAFLLGDGASYLTGAFIPVDGGGEAAVRADDWPTARPQP
jgi:NAD(P)-dependent dehydrogenase (short-subunit alcohol dehydrogenase family)